MIIERRKQVQERDFNRALEDSARVVEGRGASWFITTAFRLAGRQQRRIAQSNA